MSPSKKNFYFDSCVLKKVQKLEAELVLGGTQAGPSPDLSVYVVSGSSVEKHKISGEIPPATQEYAACANDDFMFVHGGLTATGKSNSLYRINLKVSRVTILFIQL